MKLFKTLSIAILLMLVIIPAGCGSGPKGPGEKIIMSESIGVKGVPRSVVPYGEGLDVVLQNLSFKQGSITLDYSNKNKVPFTVICYFKMETKLVVVYLDEKKRLILNSNGRVGFNLSGLKQSGEYTKGKITFSVESGIYGIYDLKRTKGKLFVFAVKGEVYSGSVLPGAQKNDQVFMAFSNVLATDFEF